MLAFAFPYPGVASDTFVSVSIYSLKKLNLLTQMFTRLSQGVTVLITQQWGSNMVVYRNVPKECNNMNWNDLAPYHMRPWREKLLFFPACNHSGGYVLILCYLCSKHAFISNSKKTFLIHGFESCFDIRARLRGLPLYEEL